MVELLASPVLSGVKHERIFRHHNNLKSTSNTCVF